MASSAIYPTLEDLSVGSMIAAASQSEFRSVNQTQLGQQQPAYHLPSGNVSPHMNGAIYPSLGGPPLQHSVNQTLAPNTNSVLLRITPNQSVVAPLTGSSAGVMKAHISHGIRQVTLCKDAKGKTGLRLLAHDNGIFVSFVMADSTASLAGIRFGDQVLQLNQANCAGWSTEKAMEALKNADARSILLAIRDRPLERTITMLKDSTNRAGFGFKNGRIEKIVEDSSAARNGILTDHQLLEINGQNVIGLSDKEIGQILDGCTRDITIAVMASKVFQHFMSGTSTSLIRRSMDHHH